MDSRADPGEVFLYRTVDRKTLAAAGVDVSSFSSDDVPVIFRADLKDPAAFFAIQQFRMVDKDMLYVANSASVGLSKFLSIVDGVSNTTTAVVVNANSTKNAINALRN